MKKIIALALALNATTAFAFFNEGQTMGNGAGSANGEVVGNGNAEGEANFSMSFTARGKTAGDFNGYGATAGNVNAQGDGRDVYRPPYYGNSAYNFPAEK